MYAFTFRTQDSAVIVFRFEDPDAALSVLRAEGVGVCRSEDVYRLAERRT